ncbi:hypothetical protein G6O67_005480 [Ophiocordyceps sinensis]|uniref:F-box domain-containing protein n=3 Tax=Ophiocordyceps sinensis TaxID=72228 RepID=A0A8H4V5Z3_9HYPO|nr:F-box domain-containing protein [Ophiocordyceps sinensis CO18]KAF4509194.1 hypothetical protein G6O67_005480 [Ophiocordyceps sinensis]
MTVARWPGLNQERIMSKWISRECNMSEANQGAFTEVGHTDFGDMVHMAKTGGSTDAVTFTVSLCGRYVMATHGQIAHVYELNHVCPPGRSAWSIPLRRRQGMPLGFLRPVTTVVCPRRIISCSMDTSAGRYAAAFLMDGRVGMVCDIVLQGPRWPKSPVPPASSESSAPGSGATSPDPTRKASRPCVCHEHSPKRSPRVEGGQRTVYRNIGHSDDPPRSVAICPQRNCVAFGCGAGIELHWVDAMAGQDLSRWFPLGSPSDFLYFLAARRGLDTAKRLRLISSAAALENPLESIGDILHGFRTRLVGSGSTAVVSLTATAPEQLLRSRGPLPPGTLPDWPAPRRPGGLLGGEERRVNYQRKSAGGADHYRAVPLSDGYHILFTDPRTGKLCLGTDAPVGSLTRLLRKVWFRPPAAAASPAPILYAAGADTRHGVRVVASFAARGARGPRGTAEQPATDRQVVVFYSVPPDLFHDTTLGAVVSPPSAEQARATEASSAWQPDASYRAVDRFSEPFHNSTAYPIEIGGQPVATCGRLSELALDSSPEMIIWAFSAEGWAKTWAVGTGGLEPYTKTTVQRDGGVRRTDYDGDVAMTEGEDDGEARWDADLVSLQRYDGAAGNTPVETDSPPQGYFARGRPGGSERMSGTVRVDLVEEVRGIVRLDVELR